MHPQVGFPFNFVSLLDAQAAQVAAVSEPDSGLSVITTWAQLLRPAS